MSAQTWYDDLLTSVAHAQAVARPQKSQYRKVAVTPAEERGPGWFRTARIDDATFGRLTDAVLAPGGEPKIARWAVVDTIKEDQDTFVRVQPAAPAAGLQLCLPTIDQAKLNALLRTGLDEARQSPIAAQFANRRLSPISDADAYRDATQRATAAIGMAGVHAVWGPPGTGKTTVIATALQEMINQRRRCVLVSTTNIAIDNAVAKLLDGPQVQPGTVVRVGTVRLPALAGRDDIVLERLVRARQRDVHETIARLEQEQVRLLSAAGAAERERDQARGQLQGFTMDDYDAARTRLHDAATRAAAQRERDDGESEAASAESELRRLQRSSRQARGLVAQAAHWQCSADLETRRRVPAAHPRTWRPNRERRAAKRAVKAAAAAQLTAQRELEACLSELAQAGESLGPPAAAGPPHDELIADVARLDAELRGWADRAAAARRRIDDAQHTIDAVSQRPPPRAGDLEYCRHADAAGLPRLQLDCRRWTRKLHTSRTRSSGPDSRSRNTRLRHGAPARNTSGPCWPARP